MYERMLNKQVVPTIADLTVHCGENAELFTQLNALTVMIRLTNKQYESVYGNVQTYMQEYIDNKYPCSDGGWIHYRITCIEHLKDIKKLLITKCS